MKIETWALSKIKPYKNNPRKNDGAVPAVAESIKQCGYCAPIIVDEDGVILAGHTRLKALKKLGWKEAEVVVRDGLTEEQKKKYRLLDNKTGEAAEWDFDILNTELEGMDFEGFDFGFEFPPEEQGEVIEDEFDETLPEEPITKLGDIWKLGRHRLMCGDSTDAGTVALLMNGKRADVYITDPPYNVDYTGKTKEALKIKNDEMNDAQYQEFLAQAFRAAETAMKPGAVFYIWHADSQGYNVRSACYAAGLTVRQCLIWVKNTLVMGRQDYQWKHEPCLYGWKDGSSHLWASDRKQTTVLTFDRPTKSTEHPTMKPVKLFDYQIQNNTKGEDAVFDGFAGSGTTVVACEQNGRIAYLMELDPKYCDVIVRRWEALTGEKAVKT
jgi:DNA modification methylase